MKRIVISDHARFEMERRQIAEDVVYEIAQAPQQVIPSHKQREIRQSIMRDPGTGKMTLVRVVVAGSEEALFVVTVYKTSRVDKYWRGEVGR